MTEDDVNKCEKCSVNEVDDLCRRHSCPFQVEIYDNDDDKYCNCCSECETECSKDSSKNFS